MIESEPASSIDPSWVVAHVTKGNSPAAIPSSTVEIPGIQVITGNQGNQKQKHEGSSNQK